MTARFCREGNCKDIPSLGIFCDRHKGYSLNWTIFRVLILLSPTIIGGIMKLSGFAVPTIVLWIPVFIVVTLLLALGIIAVIFLS